MHDNNEHCHPGAADTGYFPGITRGDRAGNFFKSSSNAPARYRTDAGRRLLPRFITCFRPHQSGSRPWLALPADAVPPLLFFFTWNLFEDDREPPLFVWLIAALYLVVVLWLGLERAAMNAVVDSYLLVPVQLIKLGFAVGAMFIVWRGRETML